MELFVILEALNLSSKSIQNEILSDIILRSNPTMPPSSSGPGYLVFIQKIAGSNPAGGTNKKSSTRAIFYWFLQSDENRRFGLI
jgi:hypothetical protein